MEFAKMNSFQLLEETEKAVSEVEGRAASFIPKNSVGIVFA